jgi:predicted DNA-binding transcriptional regulator YafY
MEKNRAIYIFKYLWDKTDEEHPVTISNILEHLQTVGVTSTRKTIAADMEALQESGFDIICNKSRQNQYFIGNRYLEVPEMKFLIDAVQAAKFISEKKTYELIEKVSSLASPYQSSTLKRNLYVDGKAKTNNECVYYIVDMLNNAINDKKAIRFSYYEYTPDKTRVFKHNGQIYEFSPYDLVWNNDCYYVFGWSESHGKVIKFRVDRMNTPMYSSKLFHDRPEDYDITDFCRQVFMMYDGKEQTVTLYCENSLMKTIIDRFGENVKTQKLDCGHFSAEVQVSASPTFYSWVFNYAGKMKITAPKEVAKEYSDRLKLALHPM